MIGRRSEANPQSTADEMAAFTDSSKQEAKENCRTLRLCIAVGILVLMRRLELSGDAAAAAQITTAVYALSQLTNPEMFFQKAKALVRESAQAQLAAIRKTADKKPNGQRHIQYIQPKTDQQRFSNLITRNNIAVD